MSSLLHRETTAQETQSRTAVTPSPPRLRPSDYILSQLRFLIMPCVIFIISEGVIRKYHGISEEDLCCAAPFAITAWKSLPISDGSVDAGRGYLLDWKRMMTRIARVVRREIVREGSRTDLTTQRVQQRYVVSGHEGTIVENSRMTRK